MTDPTHDEIRQLLERSMTDAPEPLPWSNVERRANELGDTADVRHRTGVWLVAAASIVAFIAGFVALTADDDSKVRTNDPVPTITTETDPSPAPTVPVTAAAPTTTETPSTTSTISQQQEQGWSGGLLDDLDTESLRPLDSYTEGDVIIPTGPTGWRVDSSQWGTDNGPESTEWYVNVTNALPDRGFGQQLLQVMMTDKTCGFTRECRSTGESVTINGVVWESLVPDGVEEGTDEFVANTLLRAGVGDRWVFLTLANTQSLDGTPLEEPEVIEFLEGLRVGSPQTLTAIGEACWQCGSAGAEGDPFAEAATPAATPTTTFDGAPTATSEPQAPIDVGSDLGRPLIDLAEGDVIVASYVPPGMAIRAPADIFEHGDSSTEFSFGLQTTDGAAYIGSVRLWERADGVVEPLGAADLNDPNHPPVEIAGLTWGWNDFESARIAHIGGFAVWLYLDGLDEVEAARFIEGLQAVSVEQFPGPIQYDTANGLSVVDDGELVGDEVVASDEEFEVAALRVGDEVCTKLTQTIVPVTMTFSAICWPPARLADLGIVDLYPLDLTDTRHLIIGVIDSATATAVRTTSPSGESVVVATGPVNQTIDGRFFLARLDLDTSDGIRLDHFTIEDASQ